MKNTKQLNEDHEEQLNDLVDETIMSGIMEDLCVNADDLDEDDEEEYERREMQLNKEAIDYVIKRLQAIQKDYQE